MVDRLDPVRRHRKAQTVIDHAARVALMDWWEAANRYSRPDKELINVLDEPFTALVTAYGEQSTYATVDYLLEARSLDEELAWLPEPTPAEVASYRQTRASLEWAINTSKQDGVFNNALARKKLAGALNRLILLPGRTTVAEACARDNTRYARLPEPGACSFCLMVASRGAIYLPTTALDKTRPRGAVHPLAYHDSCRCIAVEAGRGTEETAFERLPPISRELRDLWDTTVGFKTHRDWESSTRRTEWKKLIHQKRASSVG